MTTIYDLPEEMLLEIFENLNLHELVATCSKTCFEWRDVIAHYILGPKIIQLANTNAHFKRDIEAKGWTEDTIDSNDTKGNELIMSLYPKYDYYTSKYIIVCTMHIFQARESLLKLLET